MKIQTNYHTHTYRCGHAVGEDEDYILEAIGLGMQTIGFSDHVMLEGVSQPGVRGDFEFSEDYFFSINFLKEKFKERINVLLGYEAEAFPDYFDYYKELFNAIAINEYNPMDKTNNYNISKPNEYYLKLINSSHNDNWIMYENVILHCINKSSWGKVKNRKIWGKELIEKEGFIHCSTIGFFWRVAPNFKDVNEDLLLVIDENKLVSKVKYEDGDNCGRAYPHIYGTINNDAVINVLPFLKDENNNWIKNEEFKFIENK